MFLVKSKLVFNMIKLADVKKNTNFGIDKAVFSFFNVTFMPVIELILWNENIRKRLKMC